MSAAKSGQSVPHQYSATPSVAAKSPEGAAKVKRKHPWSVYVEGRFKSDWQKGQQVIPNRHRII